MDIMMRLKGAGFSMIANEFREREKRLGGGLPLQDFVEIVLQGLPRAKNADEKYATVNALVELFDEIDINGDGVMEFDEFTSFCVDAGMVATRGKIANLKHRYVRNTKHVIKTASGCVGIEKVKWSNEFQKLMAIENTAKTVKLFDATGKFVAEVGGQSTVNVLPVTPRANEGKQERHPNQNQSSLSDHMHEDSSRAGGGAKGRASGGSSTRHGGRGNGAVSASSSASSAGVFILDAVFIYKYRWLTMSTTDFAISFYDMNDTRKSPIGNLLPDCMTAAAQCGPSFALVKPLTITTTTAQLLLRFCEQSGLLFSSGNDFVLNVWKLIDAETKTLWKRLVLHQDMVMDLIEVPQHDLIVSCDLHRRILLWDIHDCRARGALVGHTHGVKQLVYSSHHDLLLSAGFEFDAYGWDIASRQIVMKLSGHRAPLVGVQIALFQTERAVTADCMGVFKVWDISRSSGQNGGLAAASSSSSSRGHHGAASQAIQLESIDPSHQFARFEPTAFVCLHPHSRDLWTATAGSATLHLFRSTRVQQLDEVPLRAFYHYNANKFIVVAGPVCSIWDGETGICLEEFTHVGDIGVGKKSSKSPAQQQGAAAAAISSGRHANSTTHNGSGSSHGSVPSVEVLTCVQDENCKKLVVVTERGELGVFNALNFVQMRKCQEVFYGQQTATAANSNPAMAESGAATTATRNPTCGIVGLHYCSANKLIIATDANESSILVIDDNTNHDSARGMKETTVLRRLTHIPEGISASAYGFHVCLVATISDEESPDAQGKSRVSLWDFETLSFVAHCELEEEQEGHALHLLEFWTDFPVLVAADTLGGVYFYAATPLVNCNTGQLLHSFSNDHAPPPASSSSSSAATGGRRRNASSSIEEVDDEDDRDENDEDTDQKSARNKTFLTETTQHAARRILRWRKQSLDKKNGTSPAQHPPSPSDSRTTTTTPTPACVVTCLKIVFDDIHARYLLFTGDESGMVRIWELTKMIKRLSLSKIPEIKCKYLRRGYHPKAMFSRDYIKDATSKEKETHKNHMLTHHQAVTSQDHWRTAMLSGEELDSHFHPSQMDLKRLSRRRLESKKRPTATVIPSSSSSARQQQAIHRASQQATTATVAAAAAEAFLVGQKKNPRGNGKSTGFSSFSSSPSPTHRGSLLSLPAPAANTRRHHSEHWKKHKDIEIVHAWQAHSDGLTSLEVTKNPDILVTCALDMRVFVWNWQGACLGKLFDAENIGSWQWQFRKDDSQRQEERDRLVRNLIRGTELTPLEKAQQRRQTLYQEHIDRKSLKDLQHVNTVLLDHIISKNPELDLLTAQVDGDRSADAETPSDTQLNAELETNRRRNSQAKVATVLASKENSPASPMLQLPPRWDQVSGEKQEKENSPSGGTSVHESQDHERDHLRIHSLAQVGPLLCVNKSEYKHQSTLLPASATSKMQFMETDDLKMDKKYLEQELSINFPTSLSSFSPSGDKVSSMSDIQRQIQVAHLAAKDAFESRTTLERKTADMYANLEKIKQRAKPQHCVRDDAKSTGCDLEQLLEPSEFLKQRIPASQLLVRPQTAPAAQKRLQLTKKLPPPSSKSSRLGSSCTSRQTQSATSLVTATATEEHDPVSTKLSSSVSERSLQQNHNLPLPDSNRRRSVVLDRRKSSLDLGFIEEVNRQHQQHGKHLKSGTDVPASLKSSIAKSKTLVRKSSIIGSNSASAAEAFAHEDDGGNGDTSGLTLGEGDRSLGKLRAINQILAKAQDYCSPGKESCPPSLALTGSKTRPTTAPFLRSSSSTSQLSDGARSTPQPCREEEDDEHGDTFDPTSLAATTMLTTTDTDLVRQHLEETKRKMEFAMKDGERKPLRTDLKKLRQNVQQQKKVRRMEDYLQQKRREMNTSIGNVFKRTSFAFQSKDADDPITLLLAGKTAAAAAAHPTTLSKIDASSKAKVELDKSSTFGIYGVREVMSVIRLFWSMDEDNSGSISLDELLQYKHFFEKLGYNDMATVFQAIDKDGNGHVSLKELLEICFHYATKYQIEEMLTLAKVGNVRSYLEGETGLTAGNQGDPIGLSAEKRQELLDIFRVFDRNGDGSVSMQELMEALRVDDDDVMAKVMAEQATRSNHGGSSSSSSTWATISSSGITKDDVERLYNEFDADRNGTLDFDEFIALMRTLYGPKSNAYFR